MNPLLFLHIPRTSGIAYRKMLVEAFRKNEIRQEPAAVQDKTLTQWQKEFIHESQHKFIAGHWGWEIVSRIPDVQVLTILRNPIDRAVSDFQHHLREPNRTAWNSEVFGITDFFEFCKTRQGYTRMHNAHIRQLCGEAWGQSEISLPENPLNLAKQNIDNCLWVNFTESPKRMVPNRVNDTLWWGERDRGIKVNITPEYIEPLDGSIIDSIIEMNQLDIQLYNYAVEKYLTKDYLIDL
jgi:hypothetical protein